MVTLYPKSPPSSHRPEVRFLGGDAYVPRLVAASVTWPILAQQALPERLSFEHMIPCRWDFCGGFHKWGYPKMDGFIMENPTKIDDLGVTFPLVN